MAQTTARCAACDVSLAMMPSHQDISAALEDTMPNVHLEVASQTMQELHFPSSEPDADAAVAVAAMANVESSAVPIADPGAAQEGDAIAEADPVSTQEGEAFADDEPSSMPDAVAT